MRRLLSLAMLTAGAVAVVPAAATPPAPVSGTFAVVTATTTSTRTAGGNTFITVTRTAALSGTFTGTTSDELLLVMHRNGTTSLRGQGTCVCSLAGRSGTFEYRFEGSGVFPTSASGRYVVGHGTGGLAGVHAEGPFFGDFLVATIGGQYHLE
jgi:hypothetical protein